MENLLMLRQRSVTERSGESRSTFYACIAAGLFTPPVKIGPAASAWPAHEVDAILAARIAGKSQDEIRQVVRELVEARKSLPDRLRQHRELADASREGAV